MNETNESFARLEVRSGRGENGEDKWVDAGPINLDETTATEVTGAFDATCSDNETTSCRPTKAGRMRNLPPNARRILSPNAKSKGDRRSNYLFKHSSDGTDTNLLVTLHGAGDTHTSFHRLARRMDLPQTAILSIHASSCANGFTNLPFGLGCTWFDEMDYSTGEPLSENSPRRLATLNRATEKLVEVLDALSTVDDIDDTETGWQPERIFLFGYSAGACLVMETCLKMMAKGNRPLGGGVCIAGGIKCEIPLNSVSATTEKGLYKGYTPVLLIVGALDNNFPPSSATKSSKVYKDSYLSLLQGRPPPIQSMQAPALEPVKLFVKEGKGHSMIGSEEETRAIMEFFSRTLVRTLPAMEKATGA